MKGLKNQTKIPQEDWKCNSINPVPRKVIDPKVIAYSSTEISHVKKISTLWKSFGKASQAVQPCCSHITNGR